MLHQFFAGQQRNAGAGCRRPGLPGFQSSLVEAGAEEWRVAVSEIGEQPELDKLMFQQSFTWQPLTLFQLLQQDKDICAGGFRYGRPRDARYRATQRCKSRIMVKWHGRS